MLRPTRLGFICAQAPAHANGPRITDRLTFYYFTELSLRIRQTSVLVPEDKVPKLLSVWARGNFIAITAKEAEESMGSSSSELPHDLGEGLQAE
jgi:hypothetical protein